MSTIIFGATVSLINSATPSTGGYLIGYDVDGILKQKDSAGVITIIGSGATGGGSGTSSSLSGVLSIGNNSGTFGIIMGTSTGISSANGNSNVFLDSGGNANNILITTNDGVINAASYESNPDFIRTIQEYGTTYSSTIVENGTFSVRIGDTNLTTELGLSHQQLNIRFDNGSLLDGDISIIKSGTTYDSGSINKAYLHLNSYDAGTDLGVQNSVVVGGSGITASESESVYVPQLVIQDSKVIKGSTGTGFIQFTEWNDVMMVSTSQNSIIGILSSSSSSPYLTSTNGIFVIDSLTNSQTPNIQAPSSFISTRNSNVDSGIQNSVVIGGIGLSATQSNTVYLGNNVNINNAFSLPNSDGVNGQVLKTDGSGNVTWQNESISSATQSLYQVLVAGNDTITEDIIMGTSTAIRSGNVGGSIFLDYSGATGDVTISTDNGNLLTAFLEVSGNNISLDSTNGLLSISSQNTTIVSGNSEGLKYAFDYSLGFVTYSLVTKGYVNSVSIASFSASNGLTGSFNSGQLSISSEVDSDSIEINGNNQISLKSVIIGNRQFNDSVTILGDLTILGTSSSIHTENLFVEDNIITLNATYSGPAVIDAGVEVNLGDGTYSKVLWNSGIGYWQVGLSGSESTIITKGDNGLTKIDNKLLLGGTISQNTTIDYDNLNFDITTNNGGIFKVLNNSITSTHSFEARSSGVYLRTETISGENIGVSSTGQGAQLSVTSGSSFSFVYVSSVDQSLAGGDNSTNNRLLVRDDYYSKGLVYYDDYTNNFTTHSLITKGYVDSLGLSTPSLGQVLAVGNTSSGYNIEISNNNYLSFNGPTHSTRIILDFNGSTSNRSLVLSNASGRIAIIDDNGLGQNKASINYFPKWTSGFTLATSSLVYDDGTKIHIGGKTSSFLDSSGVDYRTSLTNLTGSSLSVGLVIDVGSGSFGNYAIFNNLSLDGLSSSENYGIYNQIDVNNVSSVYAIRNEITGTSSSATSYGIYNSINLKNTDSITGFVNSVNGGTMQKIGILNQITDSNSQQIYGIYNSMRRGSIETYGIYMPVIGSTGDFYGISINHSVNVGTTSNPNYNIYISDTGYSSNKYGGYTELIGNGRSNINYGSYYDVSGASNNNYGVYSKISGTFGNRNIGVYIDNQTNTSQNVGLYILGGQNTSITTTKGDIIFNELQDSSSDLSVRGGTISNLLQISSSTDNIGVGTASPISSAILDVYSTSKAMVIPRLIGNVATSLTPKVDGMIVCITAIGGSFSSIGFYGYLNSNWTKF